MLQVVRAPLSKSWGGRGGPYDLRAGRYSSLRRGKGGRWWQMAQRWGRRDRARATGSGLGIAAPLFYGVTYEHHQS